MLWSSQWPVKRSALMWFQFRPSVSLACRCHSETLSQLIGMRNRWSRSNGFNSKWNEARHIVQSHHLCPIWSSLLESLYSGRAHPPVLFSILICSQLLQLRTTENWERFLSLFSNELDTGHEGSPEGIYLLGFRQPWVWTCWSIYWLISDNYWCSFICTPLYILTVPPYIRYVLVFLQHNYW